MTKGKLKSGREILLLIIPDDDEDDKKKHKRESLALCCAEYNALKKCQQKIHKMAFNAAKLLGWKLCCAHETTFFLVLCQ